MIKKVVNYKTRKKSEVFIEKVSPNKIYATCYDDIIKIIKKIPGTETYYLADLTCDGCWSFFGCEKLEWMFLDDSHEQIDGDWYQFDDMTDFANWIYKIEA